jgi:hypothetical protein
MRYRLRTLLILLAIGPWLLAGVVVTVLATWSNFGPAAALADAVLGVVVLLFLLWMAFGPRQPWKSA